MAASQWQILLVATLTASCAPRDLAMQTEDLTSATRVIDSGAIEGEHSAAPATDAFAFLGIPYAKPPVGALRWRPPAPVEPWNGTRVTTAYSEACIQLDWNNNVWGSEDCLYLNVWTPAQESDSPLPVLVFMHGGSNVSGSAADAWRSIPTYDGAYIATHGPAVVVTINYRLAAMGFLAHNAFRVENEGFTGNYGLMDQMAALEWVQRNIDVFGGDPTRVLLFGHSAGAFDTCDLLASPRAAGLFSRALMMSGGCSADTASNAAYNARLVAATLGCQTDDDIAACLRAVSAHDVTAALDAYAIGEGSFYGAVIDGRILEQDPQDAIRAGNHNKMPLVVGSTTDEMSIFIKAYVQYEVQTPAQYHAELHRLYKWRDAAVRAMYPSAAYPTPQLALETALADDLFVCPSRRAARAAARSQPQPVYRYVYAHAYVNPHLEPKGAAHGYELPFVFHTIPDSVGPSEDELTLSDEMVRYWTDFAATGDPNGAWPEYQVATGDHIVLDTPITTSTGDRTEHCKFWDELWGFPP